MKALHHELRVVGLTELDHQRAPAEISQLSDDLKRILDMVEYVEKENHIKLLI
jgi:hypothetical protein